jgi:hypothetical protein
MCDYLVPLTMEGRPIPGANEGMGIVHPDGQALSRYCNREIL